MEKSPAIFEKSCSQVIFLAISAIFEYLEGIIKINEVK